MDFGAIKMRNKMLAQLEVGLLVLLCARTAVTMESSQPDNQVVPSCSKFTNVCKFNFRVGYNMTMISWESSKGEPAMHPIVPGEDGYLYKKNNTCMKTRMSKEGNDKTHSDFFKLTITVLFKLNINAPISYLCSGYLFFQQLFILFLSFSKSCISYTNFRSFLHSSRRWETKVCHGGQW